MRPVVAWLALISVTLLAGGSVLASEAVDITMSPYPLALSAADPSITSVSAVKLGSGHAMFGGLSGMVIKDDVLYAITDKGYLLTAHINAPGGQIESMNHIRLVPLWVQQGTRIRKSDYDAESLNLLAGGRFLVSYEKKHRISEYKITDGQIKLVKEFPMPRELQGRIGSNAGLEAAAVLPNGDWLVFPEDLKDKQHNHVAWIIDRQKNWQEITVSLPDGFSVTDAVALANGDIYLLLRYYQLFRGVEARVMRIRASDFAASKAIKAQEIAYFDNRSGIDNMEGLAILPHNEKLLFYLLSDDNFNPLQKTLLVSFTYQPD